MNRVRMFTLALLMGLVLGLPAVANAGDDDVFFLTVSDEEGLVGGTATATVTLDFADAEAISGYSMAVCHDTDLVSQEDGYVVNGDLVASRTFIFHAASIRDEGWTVGAGFSIGTVLDPDDGFEMYLVDYDLLAEGETILEWCVIGTSPAVEASMVLEDLSEVKEDGTLGVVDGSINITKEPKFNYRAEMAEHRYDPTTGEIAGTDCTFEDDSVDPPVEMTVTAVRAEFSVEEDPDTSPGFPTATEGLSMAVHHDGAILEVCSAQADGGMADLRGGLGPEFIGVNTRPAMGTQSGWTVGVAFSFNGSINMEFDGETVVMSADYFSVDAANFTFDPPESATDIVVDLVFATADNPLGDPEVENALIADGGDTSFDLLNGDLRVNDGSITFSPQVDLDFVRGDCNDDGIVNIADAIFALNARFQPPGQGSPLPTCLEACDANSDGSSFESTDAVYILNYQFLEGPEPGAPFPDCGAVEEAPCETYTSCE